MRRGSSQPLMTAWLTAPYPAPRHSSGVMVTSEGSRISAPISSGGDVRPPDRASASACRDARAPEECVTMGEGAVGLPLPKPPLLRAAVPPRLSAAIPAVASDTEEDAPLMWCRPEWSPLGSASITWPVLSEPSRGSPAAVPLPDKPTGSNASRPPGRRETMGFRAPWMGEDGESVPGGAAGCCWLWWWPKCRD